MQVLVLKDPRVLGEEHPTYGWSIWSETDGDYPVMFNTKQPNIMPGTRITYESAEPKTSSKGNEYLRLKKVQMEDSPSKPDMPFDDRPKPSFSKPEPTFSKPEASNAYLKDVTNTPIMMYNGSLHYAKDTGLNLITDKEDRRVYLEYVKDVTDEVMAWIDTIRKGEKLVTPSLGDEYRKKTNKVTEEFGEPPEDMNG